MNYISWSEQWGNRLSNTTRFSPKAANTIANDGDPWHDEPRKKTNEAVLDK